MSVFLSEPDEPEEDLSNMDPLFELDPNYYDDIPGWD